jgi:Fe-S cluster assembly iron-binding protein IscA
MQRMKLKDRNPAAEVYIILRVFNLDKSNVDMRIYVDPAGTDGLELYFTFDEELNRYCVDHF